MTPRQERFVAEYLKDLNATRAAISAGFSEKTAAQQATRLLRNVQISAAVEKAKAKRIERVEVQADDVLRELMRLGYSDLSELLKWGPNGVEIVESKDLSVDARRAVEMVKMTEDKDGKRTFQIKQHSKERALELLGRHLGLFVDRLEVRGLVGVVELPNDEKSARELLRAALGDAY